MEYTRALFSDGNVCIFDSQGKEILMKYAGNTARILHMDIRGELLEAAMKDALDQGMETIIYEYFDQLSARTEFLRENGFEIAPVSKVISVNCSELFSSKGVIKTMEIPFPGIEWLPFRDMLPFRFQELEDLFAENNIDLKIHDLERFDEDISGVVLDEHKTLQALILTSTQADELIVEFIHGISKNKPMFIMALLRGFAREMKNMGLLKVYDKISMIEVNDSVRPLITRLLDRQYSVNDEGDVLSARKVLEKNDIYSSITIKQTQIFGRYMPKGLLPFQENINWKMQWKNSIS